MPKFSRRSIAELESCHIVLQRLMKRVIQRSDFSVICGFRGQKEQDKAYAEGKSKLTWPRSKHNTSPSTAVDICPWPIDWNDIDRFKELATVVKEEWALMPDDQKLRYELSWGGDWTTFRDFPHWEIRFAEGRS